MERRNDAEHAALERGAPAVPAGEEGIARGRADTAGRIGISEAEALAREPVTIGRANEVWVGAITAQAAPAEVVGKDENNVGRRSPDRSMFVCMFVRRVVTERTIPAATEEILP